MLNIIEEMLIVLVWRLGKGGDMGGAKGSGVSIAGQIILEEDIWWSQLAGHQHIHTYIHTYMPIWVTPAPNHWLNEQVT